MSRDTKGAIFDLIKVARLHGGGLGLLAVLAEKEALDLQRECDHAAKMREAIAALPEYPHEYQNAHSFNCPGGQECECEAKELNEALDRARFAAESDS